MNLSALVALAFLSLVDAGAVAPAAPDQAAPVCAGAPAAASPVADARPAPRFCALKPRAKAAGSVPPSRTLPLPGQEPPATSPAR